MFMPKLEVLFKAITKTDWASNFSILSKIVNVLYLDILKDSIYISFSDCRILSLVGMKRSMKVLCSSNQSSFPFYVIWIHELTSITVIKFLTFYT